MSSKGYDVAIVGGGVVGCAIAREMSRYDLNILLIEKECDVAVGTSGRNSGVSHAGFYVPSGTLKAQLNVKGHDMMPQLCRQLGVPHREVGKAVVAKQDEETEYLHKLKETGERNGSKGLRMIDEKELKKLEPNINGIAALHSPTSAIFDPFILTIALAENALKNGAQILLNTEVSGIDAGNPFRIKTKSGEYTSDVVINSAGLYSGKIAGMVGISDYRIHPCRGEYHLLDKNKRGLINGAVYPVPPKDLGGLGIHLTPTTEGNIMLGPSAEYIGELDDTANTPEVMEKLLNESIEFLPKISRKDIIRSFSGIRPKLIEKGSTKPADFVIEESPKVPGFINLIGIESPGLTAAPAIAEKVAGMVGRLKELRAKPSFDPSRKPAVRFSELSNEEKARLIEEKPDYGIILCRCQSITKQEVVNALENPIGARSIYSISKRCRATLGRCQGGFCLPRIVEVMEELYPSEAREINYAGKGSELFTGRKKGAR
ncbi:MAG: NAD(P)/FAD-dependent oxidoreductase [Candidatus Altiarchaeota archaeon]|nr:NAD(P)/FAD-dependent oxidoreductase [Candidatus Altiarchaeota archaeon]